MDRGNPVDLPLDIARNGHVDDQQRTTGTLRLECLDLRRVEQEVRGAARRQDDVYLGDDVADRIETDRLPPQWLCHLVGAFERSRGKVYLTDSLFVQQAYGHLAHLTGPYDEHAPAGKVAEGIRGRGHGRVTNGDWASPQPGFVVSPLCRPDRTPEDDLEPRIERTGLASVHQRPFDLAEDLRFADHHRIEAAGHAEQVDHGVLAAQPIGITLPGVKGQCMRPPSKRFEETILRRLGGSDGVELGSVACRQQHAALDQIAIDEAANALAHTAFGNEHLLPDVDGGCLMTEPDQHEIHRVVVPSIGGWLAQAPSRKVRSLELNPGSSRCGL